MGVHLQCTDLILSYCRQLLNSQRRPTSL